VVTERVVAGAPHDRLGDGRAAREADLGVVTIVTVAPEIGARALAEAGQLRGVVPEVLEGVVADVAADVHGAAEAGAPLDRI